MRRESSTVVALVGEVDDALLAGLSRSPNVSVARATAADTGAPASDGPTSVRPGWAAGAAAMQRASRLRATFVIVPADPLADVAEDWRAMWDLSDARGAAEFDASAAGALAAWRAKEFELPDYYVVVPPGPGGTGPDLYLGPLRGVRPHRVAVAGRADRQFQAAAIVDTLRSLEHGPWWPPLDELLDAARRFYAGGLAETQLSTT
jgi:hypothetical protein